MESQSYSVGLWRLFLGVVHSPFVYSLGCLFFTCLAGYCGRHGSDGTDHKAGGTARSGPKRDGTVGLTCAALGPTLKAPNLPCNAGASRLLGKLSGASRPLASRGVWPSLLATVNVPALVSRCRISRWISKYPARYLAKYPAGYLISLLWFSFLRK